MRNGLVPLLPCSPHKKTPSRRARGIKHKTPAVSYFHMGKPHTIIGAERFHFRVRDGFGWFPLAMTTGKTGWQLASDEPSDSGKTYQDGSIKPLML